MCSKDILNIIDNSLVNSLIIINLISFTLVNITDYELTLFVNKFGHKTLIAISRFRTISKHEKCNPEISIFFNPRANESLIDNKFR